MHRFKYFASALTVIASIIASSTVLAQSTPEKVQSRPAKADSEVPELPLSAPLKLSPSTFLSYEKAGAIAGITAVRRAEIADAQARKELITTQLDIARLEGASGNTPTNRPSVRAIVSRPEGGYRAQLSFSDGHTAWLIESSRLPNGTIISEITDATVSIGQARSAQVLALTFAPRNRGSGQVQPALATTSSVPTLSSLLPPARQGN
jgi:hypothetical protein